MCVLKRRSPTCVHGPAPVPARDDLKYTCTTAISTPRLVCIMARRVVCRDASELAALVADDGRTHWTLDAVGTSLDAVGTSLDYATTQTATRGRKRDESKAEIEEAAAEEFLELGGRLAAPAWRATFVRRRVALIVRGARGALEGRMNEEDAGGSAAMVTRKKDAPDHRNAQAVRSFLAAQAEQSAMSRRRLRKKRRAHVLKAAATQAVPWNRLVWEADPADTPSYDYRPQPDSPEVATPRRRAVYDGLASARECTHAIGMAILAMDGACDRDAPEYNGESTLVVSPPEVIPSGLGAGASRLVALLLWRVLGAVRDAFEESRLLTVAGALLTRLEPPPRATTASADSYDYHVAHVDRANVGSYDYSAVLYLGTKGEGFGGGDFCFVDENTDQVVEPKAGRVVIFPSGFEHLHRVCPVSHGVRFALAAWFSLSSGVAEHAIVPPAHFRMEDPVPPPSADELAADATCIDELRAQVERRLATDDVVQRMYHL